MTVRILFNPILAFIFFLLGMWLAVTLDIFYGLITILGSILFGFSFLRGDIKSMDIRSKALFYGSFVFLLLLMSVTFVFISTFLFNF